MPTHSYKKNLNGKKDEASDIEKSDNPLPSISQRLNSDT